MRLLLIILGIMLTAACTSMTDRATETSAVAVNSFEVIGNYGYGPGVDKGRTGTITVFPNDDRSLLFLIDLSVGPPSYNMGVLFDTLTFDANAAQGLYESHSAYGDKGCQWQVFFYGDSLTIKTLDGAAECGFGNGVYADGTYLLINRDLPNVYTNQAGDTLYQAGAVQ